MKVTVRQAKHGKGSHTTGSRFTRRNWIVTYTTGLGTRRFIYANHFRAMRAADLMARSGGLNVSPIGLVACERHLLPFGEH